MRTHNTFGAILDIGATNSKSLADGQLPNSKTTLYACPVATQALLTVVLVATGAVTRTANLYLKRSGSTSRRIMPKALSMDAGDAAYIDHEGQPFALSAGDAIEGDASAAAEIDYYIDGIERT